MPGAAKSTAKKVILTQYTFGQGGIDRVCTYLATGIASRGFETELIVFGRGGPAESELTALLGKDVKITYLGRIGRARTWDLIRNFPAFVRYLKQSKPDALIASANCMAWITVLGRFVGRLSDCRLALKITNPVVRTGDGPLLKLARWIGYNRAFATADSIWALSHAEAKELARHFPSSATRFRAVINPYVTAAMMVDGRATHRTVRAPSPVKQVIAIGRLAPQKRLSALVRAFALIAPTTAHLTLVGDGDERVALQTMITALGINDRVTLAGFVDDVLPYLKKADLLVLPSIYEGLPAAVLEAMAVNCPVLATDCFPAAREILEHAEGCGIIANLQPAPFAAQIEAHLAGPKPTTLSSLANVYSVDNGIANHVSALVDILQEQTPTGRFVPEQVTAEIASDVPSRI